MLVAFMEHMHNFFCSLPRIQQKLVAPPPALASISQSVQWAGFGNAVVSDAHLTDDQ